MQWHHPKIKILKPFYDNSYQYKIGTLFVIAGFQFETKNKLQLCFWKLDLF